MDRSAILVRMPDAPASLSKACRPGQWAIGFGAESENHMANALQKLENKGLEAVFLNDIEKKGICQTNTLTPVTVQGAEAPFRPPAQR